MQFSNGISGHVIAVVGLIAILTSSGSAFGGQTCIDSALNSPCIGTNTPCVCVERADLNSPGPVEGTDFSVDIVTDPSNPDVTFNKGHGENPWRVWSQVSASNTSPANLGDLFIDSTASEDLYKVEILNPNVCPEGVCNAGAKNLKSVVLFDADGWTGGSSITAGSITEDLNGDLKVTALTETTLGSVNLTIGGNVDGDIHIAVVNV